MVSYHINLHSIFNIFQSNVLSYSFCIQLLMRKRDESSRPRFQRTYSKPRPTREFISEKGVIAFLSKYSENIVPYKLFQSLDKYECVLKFIESNEAPNGYKFIFKIFTSENLIQYNSLEEKTRIYMIFFKNGEFRLKRTLKRAMETYYIENRYDLLRQSIHFLEVLANSVPRQIGLLKNFTKTLMNGFLRQFADDLMNKFNAIENNAKINKSLFEQIYPSQDEIAESSFLPNQFQTGYSSPEHLGNTLLSLEKSSFLLPIITGLQMLESGELDPRDLFLYENVYLIPIFSKEIVASAFLHFEIRVPGDKKVYINWPKSGRLEQNNLLILSKDPLCKTYDALCLSCARANKRFRESSEYTQLLNQNIVPVQIVKGSILPGQNYYMFENPEGWFTHEVCLRSLLNINSKSFPELSDAIVKHKFTYNERPQTIFYDFFPYIITDRRSDYDYNLSVLKMKNPFTYSISYRVDDEQKAALEHFLHYPLTLVNGCPGSGKTHLAREIVRVLNSSDISTPIFLIAQTNHSLDAFLEGIIDFVDPDKIVRHGGKPRTKNETLLARAVSKSDIYSELKANLYFILSQKVDKIIKTEQSINFLLSKFAEINSHLSKLDSNKVSEYLFRNLFPILNKFFYFSFLIEDFLELAPPSNADRHQFYWDSWVSDKKPNADELTITPSNPFAILANYPSAVEHIEDKPKFTSNDLFSFPKCICIPHSPDPLVVNNSLQKNTNQEEEYEEEEEPERDDLDYYINNDIPTVFDISQSYNDLFQSNVKAKPSYDVFDIVTQNQNEENPFSPYIEDINEIIYDHLKEKSPESPIKLMQHLVTFFLEKRKDLIEDKNKQINELRAASSIR